MDRDEIRRMYAQARKLDPNAPEERNTQVGHTDNCVVIMHAQPTNRVQMGVDGAINLAMILLMEALAVRQLQAAKAEERRERSRLRLADGEADS